MDTSIYMRNHAIDFRGDQILRSKNTEDIEDMEVEKYDTTKSKVCPACGKTFYKKIKTSNKSFTDKIYCNHKCKSIASVGIRRGKYKLCKADINK